MNWGRCPNGICVYVAVFGSKIFMAVHQGAQYSQNTWRRHRVDLKKIVKYLIRTKGKRIEGNR